MLRALREALAEEPPSDLDTLPTDFRLFNESIGLPVHPDTNEPHKLLPHQLDIGEYQGRNTVTNKSNKVGITEIFLRKEAWRGTVGDCQGYQIMLGAQDRELAVENMRRLQALFENSDLLRPLVLRSTATRLYLTNDTTYFVMPRNANAMRGWPRLKAAFLDEASHYGLLEDESILAATSARLANTNGYLDIVSTPHGQRGFFYRLCTQANEGRIPFKYFRLPYTVALGTLISQEFIDGERQTMPSSIFSQEYECEFISARNAAIEPELLKRGMDDFEMDKL